MRKVLLFSGGYDSTCLLAELMEESSKDGASVTCVTIQHNLTGAEKINREAIAQKAIINELTNRYPQVKFDHEIVKLESNWNVGAVEESRGLAQPIFWAMNLIPLLNSEDILYFGYILGDQALSVKADIVTMIQAACNIQDNKSIKIEFPYQWNSKATILEKLFIYYPYLINFCTSCEGYGNYGEVCNTCVPCNHLKEALCNILVSNNFSRYCKRSARKLLKRLFHINIRVENIKKEYINEEEHPIRKTIDICDA